MRRGISLVELIVATSIVVILSAIVFAFLSPSRESARQSACMSQLKQWYHALLMYSTDYEGPEQLPGLGSFKVIPSSYARDALLPYLKDDLRFCPDSSREMRERFAFTYIVRLFWTSSIPKNTPAGLKFAGADAEFARDLAVKGDTTPIILCKVHDEVYYQPREMDLDPILTKPYEIQLLLNGSVRKGRIGKMRAKTFSIN